MEKYQIIPRKFRPKRFCEVAGHEAIVTTIKNALKTERFGQAYLFCGARGCGKTSLARLFAKALNCSNLDENQEPCNACSSCLEINEGSNLDIIEIDGASNRGIDDIRELNESVGYAPSKGRYKVYIIDEVHMLTKEAFNALLKTLEEPPRHVKFFFATTEHHKVPQTIISRCQRLNLSRIPQSFLLEKLRRISNELSVAIEDAALLQISHLAEGSLRDAESMLDQLICFGKTPITLDLTREVFGLLSSQHLFILDEAIQSNAVDQGTKIAQSLYESGKDISAVIDSLLEHFRTHLQIKLGMQLPDAYKATSEKYTKAALITLLDTLIEWQSSSAKIPFKQIHLDMLLLTLIRSVHTLSLETLIQRLIDLESRLGNEKQEILQTTQPVAEEHKEEEEEEEEEEPTIPSREKKSAHPSKYDTLVRFAAVELEGSYERS